jgi:hypothetical protein
MTRIAALLLCCTLAIALLPACGTPGVDEEAVPENNDSPLGQLQRMGEAARQMGEAAEQMAGNGDGEARPPAEPVDFRRLQEMLPDEVVGLPRTGREGERSGAMGMTVSQATGTYEGEAAADGSAPRLTLKISDLGGIGAAAMFGAAWTMASIDRESERDYERTVEIDGQPAYIKYDHENRSGNFQAFVAGRFLVEVDGYGLEDRQLQAALTSVDFGRLEGMRDEGR